MLSISKNTCFSDSSILNTSHEPSKNKNETRILGEIVNQQQPLMNFPSSQKGCNFIGAANKSAKIEGESRKTNNLVHTNDENSPFSEISMKVEPARRDFDISESASQMEYLVRKTESLCLFNETVEESHDVYDSYEVDDEELLEYILAKDDHGNFAIYNSGNWKELIPYFLNMEEGMFFNLVLDLRENYCNPWHYPKIINDSIPFLRILAHHDTASLSRILTSTNSKGEYPLDNPLIRKYLAPILVGPSNASISGDRDVLFDVLNQCDDFILEAMMPLMKEIDPKNLNILLGMKGGALLRSCGFQNNGECLKEFIAKSL